MNVRHRRAMTRKCARNRSQSSHNSSSHLLARSQGKHEGPRASPKPIIPWRRGAGAPMPANAEEQSTIAVRMIRSAPIEAFDPLCRIAFAGSKRTRCNKRFRIALHGQTAKLSMRTQRSRMSTVEPEDDGPPEDTEQRVCLLPFPPPFVTSTLHTEPHGTSTLHGAPQLNHCACVCRQGCRQSSRDISSQKSRLRSSDPRPAGTKRKMRRSSVANRSHKSSSRARRARIEESLSEDLAVVHSRKR